jgi:hypothetical protein
MALRRRQTLAERVGFEPTSPRKETTRFPGVPVQPLQHLSRGRNESIKLDGCAKLCPSSTRLVEIDQPLFDRQSAIDLRLQGFYNCVAPSAVIL